MPVSPQGQLFYRISDAVGGHDVTPDERREILAGWTAAGGDDATWEKLSLGTQKMITDVEKREQTYWDDPADLPDQQGI